jgi:integrase
MKLTQAAVEKLPFPETGQVFYRDAQLVGFGLRVTKRCKSYIVETAIHGKSYRVTLGKHGVLSSEHARKLAKQTLAKFIQGTHPKQQRAAAAPPTLQQVFDEYIAIRPLKPKSCYHYTRYFQVAFAAWHHFPLTAITRSDISQYYSELCAQHGVGYANASMRLLRALFNFAQASDADPQTFHNPVKVLSDKRQWQPLARRTRVIKPHQLAAWWQAVQQLQHATFRDYLRLLLLTGLRKQEAATLQWQQIDFIEKTLLITDTKNAQPHLLPLSDFLHTLLQQRQRDAVNHWVFAGKKGHAIVDPRKPIMQVTEISGIIFSCHDLRRTFATIAEGLDISSFTVKRLLNHQQNHDITAGYVVSNVERLRAPMQRITDFVLARVTENT